MNTEYYQHILIHELFRIINLAEHSIDVDISYQRSNPTSYIESHKAVQQLFEMGMDINTFMNVEHLNEIHNTPVIQEVFSSSTISKISQLCLTHLKPEFLDHLNYKQQCGIQQSIIDSYVNNNEKKTMLAQFMDKGFKIEQKDIYSPELEWFVSCPAFCSLMIERSDTINWNHIYCHTYTAEETTILSEFEQALTYKKEQLLKKDHIKEKEISQMEEQKEKIEKIIFALELSYQLNNQKDTKNKLKI